MTLEWLHDGLSCLFWLGIWFSLGWVFQRRNQLQGSEQKVFWTGLALKVGAGLLFGVYFMLIKAQGDAFEYYSCIQLLWQKIRQEPAMFFQFLMSSSGDEIFPYHIYFTQGSPLAMIKAGLVMSVFAFNSFWGMSILLAGLVFWASWSIFKAWRPTYDKMSWWGAACLFFLPSVLFWGSGWGKDGVLWLAICMVLGGLLQLWRGKAQPVELIKNVILIGLGGFLITFLKEPLLGMIAFAMVGSVLLNRIHSMNLRYRLGFYLVGLAALLLLMFWQQRFLVELLSYQQWHVDSFESGESAYSMPVISRIRELLLYLPYLVLSGLFRPAPWEWSSGLVVFGGLEVILVVVGLIYWIKKRGLVAIFKAQKTNPIVISLLIFALCLAVASALFSQNFGTLLRYRMPALVLFLVSLWPMEEIKSNN